MNEPVPENQFALNACQALINGIGGMIIRLLPIFVIGVVQGIRFGFLQRDYLFLAVGAFVSVMCSTYYAGVGIARISGREKQAWMFFAICSGWLPYLFLMYIIFYRAVWALVRLFSTFSWSALFGALAFFVIGLSAIRRFGTITDVVRSVGETLDA